MGIKWEGRNLIYDSLKHTSVNGGLADDEDKSGGERETADDG